MDNQTPNIPPLNKGLQWPAAQEFCLTHAKELTMVGIFLGGCLTGYVAGRGQRAPGGPVIEASMVTMSVPAPKAHPKPGPALAKKTPAKSEKAKTVAKVEKPSKEKPKRR